MVDRDPIEQVIEKMRRTSRVKASLGFRPDANWFRNRLETLADELQHEYIALLGSARLQKEEKEGDLGAHCPDAANANGGATAGKGSLTQAQLDCGFLLYGPPAVCSCGTCEDPDDGDRDRLPRGV